MNTTKVSFKTRSVNGFNIFYREAGDPGKPVILLLHGFPTSSHMFRHLISHLAADYYVIAPDLSGYGLSDMPDRKSFSYTFDHLAELIGDFVDQIGLKKFSIYILITRARRAPRCPALPRSYFGHHHPKRERLC